MGVNCLALPACLMSNGVRGRAHSVTGRKEHAEVNFYPQHELTVCLPRIRKEAETGGVITNQCEYSKQNQDNSKPPNKQVTSLFK